MYSSQCAVSGNCLGMFFRRKVQRNFFACFLVAALLISGLITILKHWTYAQLKALLLARDETLDPPTHIRYFLHLLKLVLSIVKERLYSISAQLSIQCLLLAQRILVFHHLRWLCLC